MDNNSAQQDLNQKSKPNHKWLVVLKDINLVAKDPLNLNNAIINCLINLDINLYHSQL